MDNLERLLREHPFAQELSDDHIAFMAGCASNHRFSADEFLIREGKEANATYLIRDGKTAIEIYVPGRGPYQVETLEGGEMIGWSWLFANNRWQFDVRTVEPTRVLIFDGKCMREKCEKDPVFGYAVTKRLLAMTQSRLQHLRQDIVDMHAGR